MILTFNQKVAFAVALFSFLAAGGAAADLVILFGSNVAKSIGAASSILAGVGGIFLGVVTGQGSVVKSVQDMPGVEKIVVNKDASAALATLAVDPANLKIEPTPAAQAAVEATAKAAS